MSLRAVALSCQSALTAVDVDAALRALGRARSSLASLRTASSPLSRELRRAEEAYARTHEALQPLLPWGGAAEDEDDEIELEVIESRRRSLAQSAIQRALAESPLTPA